MPDYTASEQALLARIKRAGAKGVPAVRSHADARAKDALQRDGLIVWDVDRQRWFAAEHLMADRQEVEAVEAVVEKARWYRGVMANWQIERVAVDAIAALDRVRAERAEAEGMVKLAEMLAWAERLEDENPITLGGWLTSKVLAEFGEASDGR